MYMSVCKGADHSGAYVLHGSRRSMHNEKQPAFKAVYSTFKEVSKECILIIIQDFELLIMRIGIHWLIIHIHVFEIVIFEGRVGSRQTSSCRDLAWLDGLT